MTVWEFRIHRGGTFTDVAGHTPEGRLVTARYPWPILRPHVAQVGSGPDLGRAAASARVLLQGLRVAISRSALTSGEGSVGHIL